MRGLTRPLVVLSLFSLTAGALALGCKGGDHTPTPRDGERWAQVKAWAAPSLAPGPSGELKKAVERLAYAAGATEPQKAAYASFRAWRTARGGLPTSTDPEARAKQAIAMLEFGDTALSSAIVGQDLKRLEDTVYLAERLWSEGRSLMEVSVGIALVDRIAAAHDRLNVVPSLRARPIPQDIVFIAAAREAVHREGMLPPDTGGDADLLRSLDVDLLNALVPLRDKPAELLKQVRDELDDIAKIDNAVVRTLAVPPSAYDHLDEVRQAVQALTRGR